MKQEGDTYNYLSTFHLDLQPITVTVSFFTNFNALWKRLLDAFYFSTDPSFSTLKDFSILSRGMI